MGSITNLILKLQKSRFARRFQYEPYIIKSVEYIEPKKGESLFVVYREVDYFKSLAVEFMDKDDYFSWNVEEAFLQPPQKVDKVVFFISTYYMKKDDIDRVIDYLKDDGYIYCVCYLSGSVFFETTLRITDKNAFGGLNREMDLFEGVEVVEEVEFKKQHIRIVKMRRAQ
ncbi:hypothetical protein [Hippea sp. KM1]|uniref:hypothetical protein n=1 Tax=Hippea sp. KM1 TaxID=944481 RepID=UPI00046CD012|nr:hypothetical protein [Hippea sp. KM1]